MLCLETKGPEMEKEYQEMGSIPPIRDPHVDPKRVTL